MMCLASLIDVIVLEYYAAEACEVLKTMLDELEEAAGKSQRDGLVN